MVAMEFSFDPDASSEPADAGAAPRSGAEAGSRALI
jgi:hypothetical protein